MRWAFRRWAAREERVASARAGWTEAPAADPTKSSWTIRQIMPAGGWSLVETRLDGTEVLQPLVGWALRDPQPPAYREGGEPPWVAGPQRVQGLVAPPDGGPVRLVDEQAPTFRGYRLTP